MFDEFTCFFAAGRSSGGLVKSSPPPGLIFHSKRHLFTLEVSVREGQLWPDRERYLIAAQTPPHLFPLPFTFRSRGTCATFKSYFPVNGW